MDNQENGRGNTGAWFNIKNWKDMRLIFNPEEQPPEGFVRAEPLRGVEYQKYNSETEKWEADPQSEALEKIAGYKAELTGIDLEAGAGRAVRALALGAAEKNQIAGKDYETLKALEDRAEELRAGIAELEGRE